MLGDRFHRFWMYAWGSHSHSHKEGWASVKVPYGFGGTTDDSLLCNRWHAGIHNNESSVVPPNPRKPKMCKTLLNWHFGDFYCPHGPWPTEASNPPDFDPNPCNLKFLHNFEYPGALPADPQNGLLAWLGAKQDPPQPHPKHENIVSCSRSKRVPTEKYRKSRKNFFWRCG